ncbi:MAG TPA: 30S ribosomal protein S20 [Candidatus Moranbacteria bacterium]|nr:30S ribosomal protein S20 [Candidatus Moranbacteria bacterium]HRZ33506.1 30S ribosomal protein S20 [Candidatus Moranbacteria bacterium]
MPIKKSAKKYMRVTERKTLKNRKIKGVLKNAVKQTKEYLSAGKIDEAQASLKVAIKAIDKAAQKKVIKKNTAARKKSRLNALVKKVALKK